ncbi:DNA-packaging protein [Phaeobacter sp. G2]|nr:DNA-packaging protein [Phaeobacter sp. G2]
MTAGNQETEKRGGDGRFKEGNRFWKARASHGRPPLYNDPDHLWRDCCGYFEWTVDNPLCEQKAFVHQGEAVFAQVSKMRAMTIAGLCNFLGITRETWIDWRNKRADLSEVISCVEAVIWRQKFEGAAAGLLNANLISRDLGLVDRQEHTGEGGGPIKAPNVTDLELARRVAFLLAKGARESDAQESQNGPSTSQRNNEHEGRHAGTGVGAQRARGERSG